MSQIQWGSIADWVSGIGSLSAAIVALYVADRSWRIKLQGFCGIRLIIGSDMPTIETLTVSATNVCPRPTVVKTIALRMGVWRWRQMGIITFAQGPYSHGLPKQLNDGETGSWSIVLDPPGKWVADLVEKFDMNWWKLRTLRIGPNTTNGGTTWFRPEAELRNLLLDAIRTRKPGHASAATSDERPPGA